MEDEAQHNIEEEKRKSRILTDVSTEFAKAPILKCSELWISGSLGPRTAEPKFVLFFICSGRVRSEVSTYLVSDPRFQNSIGPSSTRMLSELDQNPWTGIHRFCPVIPFSE